MTYTRSSELPWPPDEDGEYDLRYLEHHPNSNLSEIKVARIYVHKRQDGSFDIQGLERLGACEPLTYCRIEKPVGGE